MSDAPRCGDQRVAPDYALVGQARRVDLLVAIERQRRGLDAREQRLLQAMATDSRLYPDGVQALDKDWVREDVACALQLSANTAQARLDTATALCERFPATLAAVAAGQITLRHAQRLLDSVAGLDHDAAARVEAAVLPKAGRQTVAQFVASCARAVIAADPNGAEKRAAAARRTRRVVITPLPDGMAELLAILPAADAWAIKHILDTAAQHTSAPVNQTPPADGSDTEDERAADERTTDERRADALVDLVRAGHDTMRRTARPTERSGRQRPRRGRPGDRAPLIQVTVAASTLTGDDDQPADLDGYGPITADEARRLARDPLARWRTLTVDVSGRLLDVGRTRYRPPEHIARHVRIEAGACYFPGCRRRAVTCELDHVVPWPRGSTSVDNLRQACPRHHHVKHEGGWQVARCPDGGWRWTSPSGHTYDRPPPDHLPVDRAAVPRVVATDPPPY